MSFAIYIHYPGPVKQADWYEKIGLEQNVIRKVSKNKILLRTFKMEKFLKFNLDFCLASLVFLREVSWLDRLENISVKIRNWAF